MATSGINIDLAALEAEVGQISEQELREQLLNLRVKQRVQQKKYQNTEAAQKYRKERAEKNKLLMQRAKQLGIYDQIKDEADKRADQQLAGEEADIQAVEA